jgi:anti-sigma factor ChrR (cupin superfamily)
MPYHVPEKLNDDLHAPVIVDSESLPWTPSPHPGVERRFLERRGGEIARATSIVRYAPGSSFSPHVHDEGEEFLVLEGVFSDDTGDFAAGTYVRNPPGSRHAPFTKRGCVIFVKLRQIADADRVAVIVDTASMAGASTEIAGLARVMLHRRDGGETVALEVLQAGTTWRDRGTLGGEEILVLDGALRYGEREYRRGTWLRFPPGGELPIGSSGGCRLWTKRGHLRG